MSVEEFEGLVLIAVVDDGAIVAGEYQDGVVRQLEAVEGVHDLSDGPVELQDYVSTSSQTAFPGKTGMRDAWHVYVLRTHI